MANNIKQTAIQMANQVIGQLSQQPPSIVRIPPKPIFVMRIPATLSISEVDSIRAGIAKDNITDDYHILVIPSGVTEFEFELYNADKIEVQKWNELVNRILK